jgi:hypothetical protein
MSFALAREATRKGQTLMNSAVSVRCKAFRIEFKAAA